MRNLILTIATMSATACAAGVVHPVDLEWKIAGRLADGKMLNELTLINNSDDSIRAPWSMYYGSLSSVLSSEDPSVNVEQICGSHHRFYTGDRALSIAPRDTLNITLSGYYLHLSSFFPENPYLVATGPDGKPMSPMRVNLRFEEADHEQMAASIPDYPDGPRVYDHNKLLLADDAPGIYDIIPSFKDVKVTGKGECRIDGAVSVIADKGLETERAVLADMFRRQGVAVRNGATPVRLRTGKQISGDEGYSISVTSDGIDIFGPTQAAVHNGACSLLAILAGRTMPVALPSARISDWPDFGYRGLHFDVARNFSSKENVKKLLDIMSLYKLNVLQFHLVDDEGWRLAIDGIPELTEIGSRRAHDEDIVTSLYPLYGSGFDGATSGNGFYTRADFVDILRYAADRHIKVIPEIDIPGHSRAAIMSMNVRYDRYKESDPERATEFLLCDFDDESKYTSAQEYHDNVMNIAMPSSVRFVKKVFDEVIDMYAEAGHRLDVIHVGGDEVPDGAWEGSPIAIEYMRANNIADTRALRDAFLYDLYKYLTPKGIKIGGWQEILTEADGKTPNRTLPGHEMISYSWNAQPYNDMDQLTYSLVNAGFPTVFCNVNNLYLDLASGRNVMESGLQWGGYVDEFTTFATLPFDIYRSDRSVDHPEKWASDPSAGKVALRPDAAKNILGIQGQMWAETYRNFDMIEIRLLPKMFGLAERAWNASPAWAEGSYEDFRKACAGYAARTSLFEFGRLAQLGVNYHVAAPGLIIKDGKLLANSPYPNAAIHYTTDGSDPDESSEEWTSPVKVAVKKGVPVRARAYVNGRASVITELFIKN